MPGKRLLRGLGGQRLAHLAAAGEEDLRDRRQLRSSRSSASQAAIFSPSRAVGLAAGLDQRARRLAHGRFVERRHPLAVQALAQPAAELLEAGLVARCWRAARRARASSRFISSAYSATEMRRATVASAVRRSSGASGSARCLDLLVLRLAQQRRGLGLVHHLEARRHAGLEREALEQGLAEGVDGQDLDAARRIEHAREQPAREAALLGLRHRVDQRGDLLAERLVVGHRPAAELHGEPVAHLRRRRLGEGEAEDALGPHAVEQQARDAVGQHLGLAGAGIGHDPGRLAGHGGAALRVARDLQDVEVEEVASFLLASGRPFGDALEMLVVVEVRDELGPRQGGVGRRRDRRSGRSSCAAAPASAAPASRCPRSA